MEMFSANMETRAMRDAALARSLVADIAGNCWRGKGDMLDRVYDAIVYHLPTEDAKRWTRRRVRAFWHREAAGVRYHEMIELAEVAKRERVRQAEIEGARKEHADFVARTARLAQSLAAADADFHREAIAAFGRVSGRENDRSIERVASRGADAASHGCGALGMVVG